METIVSIFMDKFKWSRSVYLHPGRCLFTADWNSDFLGFGALDFIKPLGMSILDAMDFISNSVLMPIVAVLTCVFVGFVIKPQAIIDEVEASDNGAFKSKKCSQS